MVSHPREVLPRHAQGAPLVTASKERPIPRAEVLRGYEVEADRYVVFGRRELRGLQRKTSPTIEIVNLFR